MIVHVGTLLGVKGIACFSSFLERTRDRAGNKPFREEPLSSERLEERALALAANFTIDPRRRRARNIFPRLRDNARSCCTPIGRWPKTPAKGVFVTPATEWFLDNFHLITSEIVAVRQHLPRHYYSELPALATREQAGDARIYAIAVELLRYSDSRLDLGQLTQFLNRISASRRSRSASCGRGRAC